MNVMARLRRLGAGRCWRLRWPCSAARGRPSARTLARSGDRGSIGLCAHPNSLPFASRTAEPPGFQIELGRALAQQLGVSLTPDWVLISLSDSAHRLRPHPRHDRCERAGRHGFRHQATRSPIIAAASASPCRTGSAVTSFNDLNAHTKVARADRIACGHDLDRRHVPISVFGFEDDMLAALAAHEVDAAAVTPMTAGYYNLQHPDPPHGCVPPDESEHDLVWNVAVGMRRPDDALRAGDRARRSTA